jgi:hypothetical protein
MTVRCDQHEATRGIPGVRRNRENQGLSNHNSALLAMCLMARGMRQTRYRCGGCGRRDPSCKGGKFATPRAGNIVTPVAIRAECQSQARRQPLLGTESA